MNALQLFLHRTTWQRSKEALAALRWPSLSLVAMACATVALWFASEELQNQQTLLQEETNLTHKRAEALRVSPVELAPARGLEGFQSAFPDSALREQRTLGVLVLARRYGLVVKETNLKPLAASALGLAGYDMGLPLTGSYTALRGFVDEALRADPGLAMRSIQLLRKDIQTDNLQAQLVFTFWMRQGGRL